MSHESNVSSRAPHIVGRAAEVGYLEQCLEAAMAGTRQVVFISGEAGIGKTTIVECFLQHLQHRTDLHLGQGQCIEQYGAGEAYLPLLEIGTRLCQGPNGEHALTLLRQYAPTWLVQLSGVISEVELEHLQRRLQGTTRERMLREAAEVMVRFTQEQGYVLVLEDLHWSDASTLEWLSYIAQRREPAKLLLIGTYRPQDALIRSHPLRGVIQELTARNRCEELRVTPLSEQSVSEYLSSRFSSTVTATPLPGLIHRRTGGNPLFVVNVIDDLLQQGVLRKEAGRWQVRNAEVDITKRVPNTLRQAIERQIERLPVTVQPLLEVASVAGVEFSAAAIAAGLRATVEEIDQQCEALARQGQFIEARGTEEWPDGTLSERYSFRHALYHAVLYERLTETQRVRLHRRIAERKELAYGQRVNEIAAEFALHFEKGYLYQKAVDYCQLASGAALERYARHEAAAFLTKGLQLLQRLPDSPDRRQQELEFNVTHGTVLIGAKGYAAPETERAYRRAWELCQQLGDTPQRFPVLDGLRHYYSMRGEQRIAYRIEEQLLTLAQQTQDSALMLWAYGSRGVTLLWLGAFVEARTHLESRLAFYESYQPRADLPRYGDPAVMGLSHLALALWMLGYPEQAKQKIQQALTLAQQLADAFNIAYAQTNGSLIYQHRREGAVAQELAEAVIPLATDHGLPFWLAAGHINRGWTLVEQGRTQEGIHEIEYGIRAWRATGAANAEPYFLTLLAEGHAKAGHAVEALAIVAQALARIEQTEEHCWEAELYRLKGELTLAGTRDWGRKTSSIQRQTRVVNKEQEDKQSPQVTDPQPPTSDPLLLFPHSPIDPFFDSSLRFQPLTRSPHSPTPNTFRHEGEYWTVTFAEKTCRIRHTLGMRYLAQLLSRPHEEIHVLTLVAEESHLTTPLAFGKPSAEVMQLGFTDAGDVLDPQARAAYRQQLRLLQEELAQAQTFNDSGRLEKLQEEIEFLTQELSQAVGLGGRARKAASVAERARVNVTKRIKIALRKLSEQHPTLGEHLTRTVRTGVFCIYRPLPQQFLTWEI